MKTAIVTGATGNMGQAVVKKFIEEGYFYYHSYKYFFFILYCILNFEY